MSGTEALIQAAIYQGFGLAALVLGKPCTQYRPNGSGPPIVSGNIIQTLQAAFTTDAAYSFKQPSKYNKAEWFGLFDPTLFGVGDYIVGTDGTFFLASMESLTSVLVMKCNNVLTLSRPTFADAAGANAPWGDSVGTNEPILLTSWPAVTLIGGRAEGGAVDLPDDVRMSGWVVFLPLTPGIVIREADVLTDTNGLRRIVSGAEFTTRGWRLVTLQAAD